MILLPRGNPVKEHVNPGKVNLPEALSHLHNGRFSGYLRFDFGDRCGIVVFQSGQMIGALFEAPGQRLVAGEALAMIFRQSLLTEGQLGIYRLSPELALSIHNLLHGEVLQRSQYLQQVDIRALLGRMHGEQRTGCLRVYSRERVVLIFYRDGLPLGFFCDGATDIETAVDLSLSVAREPGAKVDVLVARSDEGQPVADLMTAVDLAALWKRVRETCQRRQNPAGGRTAAEAG